MILEDKILAYLDGTLGESEREELLHTLSISPEKRAVLEEHLRLKDLLACGQKPLAIPSAVERSLASRIPALAESNRTLLAPIAERSFFSAALLGVRSFFIAHTVSTALLLGSAATGTAIWGYQMMAGNSAVQGRRVAGDVKGGAQAGVSYLADGSDLADRSHEANVTSGSDGAHKSFGTNGTYKTMGIDRANQSDRAAQSYRFNGSHESPMSHPSHRADLVDISNQPDQPNQSNLPNDESSITAVPLRATAIIPPGQDAARTLKDIVSIDQDREHSLSIGAFGTAYSYQLPHEAGSAPSPKTAISKPEFSIMYGISQSFRIGLESGSIVYSLVNQSAKPVVPAGFASKSYSRVVYQSDFQTPETQWIRLAAQYILNPVDQFPVYASIGGGVAFESKTEPIAAAAIGITHVIAANVSVDAAIVGSAVWGASGASSTYDLSSSSGVVGILHPAFTSSTTMTPAFGFRLGLRFQP